MSSEQYQIVLPQFEGPFDLLLFFIERDEVDIYNIPIQKITQDFLNYIKSLESINIELASEFILFVSTLMKIKSKMLLPRREMDHSGNEIDPRQELVDKILEYKRFKDAAAAMSVLEIERLYQLKRGNIAEEMHQLGEHYAEGTEIQSVSIFKIMSSFERIIKKLNLRSNEMQHVVVKYNYSMETQRKYIIEEMKEKKRASFEQVFSVCEDRIHAIFTFLAILEMVQQKFISILTTENYNSFMLEWNNIEVPNKAPSFNSGF